MQILTAWDLYKGKTGTWNKSGSTFSQPLQMLPRKEKDKQWREENMDWWEYMGIMQLRTKYKRLHKDYNLAAGVIDKTDYMPDPNKNEYGEMINILTQENESPYEIRFYPLIPNIINVLLGEFSKRNTRISVKAIDEYAINEMLEKKREMITQYVIERTKNMLVRKMAEQGIDIESEEAAQQLEQVPNLPQIQEFFKKSFRSVPEQWAIHELEEAEERFKMYELEVQGFKDKLISCDEFWHVRLLEDDYQVELWNPMHTFWHKSPDVSYVSEGNYAGRIHLLTIADVIDKFGYLMTEEQLKSLQNMNHKWVHRSNLPPSGSPPSDYYDTTKKPSDQIQSIHWHQAVSEQSWLNGGMDKPFFEWLRDDDTFGGDFLSVTEVYWKSQKKLGHLKQIDEAGNMFEDVVTEDFQVTIEPKYDLTINRNKTKDNVIFGQHVDWFWVNEVWKGIKIGISFINSWAGMSDGFDPIYLDVKPLPFQFKADGSLYNAKLPVEGFLGYNRNVKKNSLVSMAKPFQIGYNMVNNQISDLLVDEVGNVIMLDQNMIPKNSLDGSWGKYNFTKAFQVMKNFGILPVDSSITNTETPTNFNNTQAIDLSKTNQLLSRIQLADYFRNECFATVGISRQRLGDVTSSESATGVEYSVNNSYAQTEMYFIEHSNYLMPRVKEMILNAAQFINANKPTIRKNYINREEENVFFETEGTRILLADLKIYCTSKPDQKAILDQLKQLAINNNTSGATVFDLAKIIQSNSVTGIIETLKSSVDKLQEQQQAELENQNQINQQNIEAQAAEAEALRAFEAEQNELDRTNQRYIAEVRALAFNEENDLNTNAVPDALEVQKINLQQGKIQGDMALKQQKQVSDNLKNIKDREIKAKELEFKKKQLQEDIRLKEKALKVQQENDKADLQIQKMKARQRPKKS